MPSRAAIAFDRGSVRVRQARLCDPARLDGLCQIISSS
jgi:hypothetical protein